MLWRNTLVKKKQTKTREQELNEKIIEKMNLFSELAKKYYKRNPNNWFCEEKAELKGIKLGKQIRKDEIIKKLDEMIDRNKGGLDDIETWKNELSKSVYKTESRIGYTIICDLKRLKQEIKGDEK